MRFVFVILLLLSTIDANGQALVPAASATSPAPPAPAAGPAPLKVGDVTVTGTLRPRVYAWDWFQPASGNNEYQYSGNLLRLNFSENGGKGIWDAELGATFLNGLPAVATGTGPAQAKLG